MSNVNFVLDTAAVRDEILNSDAVLEECKTYAEQKAASQYSNEGFHIMAFKGTQRCHAIAFPNTKEHPG